MPLISPQGAMCTEQSGNGNIFIGSQSLVYDTPSVSLPRPHPPTPPIRPRFVRILPRHVR